MLHGVYKDRTASDHAGPSEAIWSKCPWLEILENPGKGYTFFDDFITAPVGTAGATVYEQGYAIYCDAGNTAQGVATEVGGVFRITTDATQHDEGSITTGGAAGMGKIASTSGKDLWFEARVRLGASTENAFFIGLAEEGLAVVNTLVDGTGVLLTTGDFVGFHILQADSDGLDAIHQINAGARTVIKNEAQVIVASAWYKVGLKFDASAGTLKYYVDNAVVGTVTDVSAATFPDGEELALLMAMKTPSAAIRYVDLDWWRFAQLS